MGFHFQVSASFLALLMCSERSFTAPTFGMNFDIPDHSGVVITGPPESTTSGTTFPLTWALLPLLRLQTYTVQLLPLDPQETATSVG